MGIPRGQLNAKALAAVEKTIAKQGKPAPTAWKMLLPLPPTVNHYYVLTAKGMVVGKRGKEYRHVVSSMVGREGCRPMEGRLYVEIAVFWPDKKIRDLDNLLKCLLDSLQRGGAYKNDNQIKGLYIYEAGHKKGGEVVVQIEAMP